MKGTLEDWQVLRKGVRGSLNGKYILTSIVMSIEGDLITTRSGSVYKLGTPSEYTLNQQLPMYNISTPLGLVARVVELNKESVE